jgi:hypothetical protein
MGLETAQKIREQLRRRMFEDAGVLRNGPQLKNHSCRSFDLTLKLL